nr:unnamed protein product [Callosobruchus chinensis]
MTDMRLWSHEFIAEFIDLYKSFPCLYEIKSKDYLNKGMKLSAYNQLVEKLKTLDPTATKDTVVKKINNMQLKKIRESRRTGSSGEIYESSLWYFHLLDFLYDQEVPRKSHSNMEEEESSQDDENSEAKTTADDGESVSESITNENRTQRELPQNEECESDPPSPRTPSTAFTSISNRRQMIKKTSHKRKAPNPDAQQNVLNLVAAKLQDQNKYANYAAYVGQELQALDPMMATYCQKMINDALFAAKCGTLTANSRIVAEPPATVTVTNPQQFNSIVTEYNVPSDQPPSTSLYYRNFVP